MKLTCTYYWWLWNQTIKFMMNSFIWSSVRPVQCKEEDARLVMFACQEYICSLSHRCTVINEAVHVLLTLKPNNKIHDEFVWSSVRSVQCKEEDANVNRKSTCSHVRMRLTLICTTNCFPWYEWDMRHLYDVLLKKKETYINCPTIEF